MYLYGIHSDGSSEYRECKLTDVYQYYREICKNCGIRRDMLYFVNIYYRFE